MRRVFEFDSPEQEAFGCLACYLRLRGAEPFLGDQPVDRGLDACAAALEEGRLRLVRDHGGVGVAGRGGRLRDAVSHEAQADDAEGVEPVGGGRGGGEAAAGGSVAEQRRGAAQLADPRERRDHSATRDSDRKRKQEAVDVETQNGAFWPFGFQV